MNCHCGGLITEVQVEDETTVSAVCHLGHREYLFLREDGTFETQADRKKRLNRYRVCEECEKEYMLHEHEVDFSVREISGHLCPECAKPVIELRQRNWKHVLANTPRDNSNSPWRIPKFRKAGKTAAAGFTPAGD